MPTDEPAGGGRGRADGQSLAPLSQFILKIHSRCNLSCRYCYVYTMADQSWRDQPVAMTPTVLALAAQRIAEHAVRNAVRRIRVVLHGGEPLLAGHEFIDLPATMINQTVGAVAAVDIVVQTNGVLLEESMLDLLRRKGIRVGVSLDGGPTT